MKPPRMWTVAIYSNNISLASSSSITIVVYMCVLVCFHVSQGMQHRSGYEEQVSRAPSLMLFLQNNTAAQKWPLTEEKIKQLKEMLRMGAEGG